MSSLGISSGENWISASDVGVMEGFTVDIYLFFALAADLVVFKRDIVEMAEKIGVCGPG